MHVLGPGNKRSLPTLVSCPPHCHLSYLLTTLFPWLLLFFTTVRIPLLDGKGVEKAKENLLVRYVPTMKANYMLWPAAQVCMSIYIYIYIYIYVSLWCCWWSVTCNRCFYGNPTPARMIRGYRCAISSSCLSLTSWISCWSSVSAGRPTLAGPEERRRRRKPTREMVLPAKSFSVLVLHTLKHLMLVWKTIYFIVLLWTLFVNIFCSNNALEWLKSLFFSFFNSSVKTGLFWLPHTFEHLMLVWKTTYFTVCCFERFCKHIL